MAKKKALADEYDRIHKSTAPIKTEIYKKYVSIFGVEASVLLLQEFSNYTSDQIWLFTVETFAMEVKKYNLKAKADHKEMEAEMKLMEAKNKIR